MKRISSAVAGPVRRLSKQHGASLLEVIAYLGVAAVVVLGAVSLLGTAFTGAQSGQTAQDLVSLRTAVKKLYNGGNYGTSEMTALLSAANVLPSSLKLGGTAQAPTVTNSWGGTVTITGANTSFSIAYPGMPKDACLNIVAGATGWSSIGNGSTSVSASPATPADANTLCAAATNTITFSSL